MDSADHELCETWREIHTEPLQWVRDTVERRLRSADVAGPVVGRLKRMPQIIRKLSSGSTRLTQMQDVGGCRAVLLSPEEVTIASRAIGTRASPWYEVVSMSDYRELGRSDTGYRALHLVSQREGFNIEIQLRTRRQHAWAEAVERVATLLRCNLKWGDGPPEVVDFFHSASDGLWLLDTGQDLSRYKRKDLAKKFVHLKEMIADASQETSRSHVLPKDLHNGTNLWLLLYDWTNSKFLHWMDLKKDVNTANEIYARWEEKYPAKDGYEVVLIGASSSEDFGTTHSHYFMSGEHGIDPSRYLEEICEF